MATSSEEPIAKRQCVSEDDSSRAHRRGAIVTGAASGIGLATAKVLADRGCVVLFADRNEELGRERAAAAGQLFKYVDVSDETSVQALAAHAKEVLPNLTYLVNVAGCDFTGGVETCSSSQFDRAIQVNVKSMFMLCREALPLLKATQGSVVNVSSIQAHRAYPEYTAYAASKGAILSMTRQLAGDFAKFGIRINTVSPGVTFTNVFLNSHKYENQYPDFRPKHKGTNVLNPESDLKGRAPESGKLMQSLAPVDVAEAISAMLSLRGVTGQDLLVDGGCSIVGVPVWKPFPAPEDFPQIRGIE